MKKIVALVMTLVIILSVFSVPVQAQEPVVGYEYAVITGIIESRHDEDCMERIFIELADGNVYETETVVDDYALYDIVLIRRFKANPDDPTDDWVQILRYVGWEQWFPTHMWNIMDEWVQPLF